MITAKNTTLALILGLQVAAEDLFDNLMFRVELVPNSSRIWGFLYEHDRNNNTFSLTSADGTEIIVRRDVGPASRLCLGIVEKPGKPGLHLFWEDHLFAGPAPTEAARRTMLKGLRALKALNDRWQVPTSLKLLTRATHFMLALGCQAYFVEAGRWIDAQFDMSIERPYFEVTGEGGCLQIKEDANGGIIGIHAAIDDAVLVHDTTGDVFDVDEDYRKREDPEAIEWANDFLAELMLLLEMYQPTE